MPKTPDPRNDQAARKYIADILKINESHGMGGSVPAERVDSAIREAGSVMRNLRSASA